MEIPNVLTISESLHDHAFQDWLVQTRIMARRSGPANTTIVETGNPMRPRSAEIILEQLQESEGYIVPREDIAQRMYGSTLASDLDRASTWIWTARERMEVPEELLRVQWIGSAVGVTEFHLRPAQIPLLYYLWKNLHENVTLEQLTLVTHGDIDDHSRSAVMKVLTKLREQNLSGTDARLLWERNNDERFNYHFRLTDRDHEGMFEVTVEDMLPPYLNLAFQDWLASKDVQLIVKSTVPKELRTSLRRGVFSPDQEKIAKTLLKYAGYIISINYFSRDIYGTEQDGGKGRALVKNTRERVNGNSGIVLFHKLGVGVGVKEVKVPSQALQVLHQLWADKGKAIPAEQLALELFGELNQSNFDKIIQAISDIRAGLEDSQYEIASFTLTERGRSNYVLRRKEQTDL